MTLFLTRCIAFIIDVKREKNVFRIDGFVSLPPFLHLCKHEENELHFIRCAVHILLVRFVSVSVVVKVNKKSNTLFWAIVQIEMQFSIGSDFKEFRELINGEPERIYSDENQCRCNWLHKWNGIFFKGMKILLWKDSLENGILILLQWQFLKPGYYNWASQRSVIVHHDEKMN